MHFLEQAAQLAGNFNLKDLLGVATSELQKISIDDLGLVEHSVRVPIPAEQIEEYMAEYTSADSWRTAMLLLIRAAPSGDPDSNRQAAEKLAKDTPLFRERVSVATVCRATRRRTRRLSASCA
jgi:hypothetical protein